MAVYNLGRILPIWKGIWDPTIDYYKMDIVLWNANSWVAINDNTNSEPADDNANWLCIARGSNYSDWSQEDKDAFYSDLMANMGDVIQNEVNHFIQLSLMSNTTIQQWMSMITYSQSQYDALANKNGIHFVYPD